MRFKIWSNFIQRLEIFRTNYGRTAGWYVEKNERNVALLSEPHYVDMFWESYLITPWSDDPAEREAVMTEDFWRDPDLKFKNVQFNMYAEYAFPALSPFTGPGRVAFRCLYLIIKPPAWWERILLTIKKPYV